MSKQQQGATTTKADLAGCINNGSTNNDTLSKLEASHNMGSSVAIVLNGSGEKQQQCCGSNDCSQVLQKLRAVRARLQRLPLDWFLLTVVLLVVWGLLLLPIIYFHTEIRLDVNTTDVHNLQHLQDHLNISHAAVEGCSLDCRENFFCLEHRNICVPTCPSWSDYPQSTAVAIDVLVIFFACIGIVCAVGVLVISCLRHKQVHKQVFTFPSIFVFYETITILTLMVLFLINYTSREFLYCSSGNLLDSIYETSTPFCTISGMVLYYCMLQLNIWWVFHVTVLCWKIGFPYHSLHYAYLMPRIHFVLVCLGITVPLIPVIATISHSFLVGYAESEGLPSGLGFGLATFPPILCYTLNKNVVFYSFILPVTLLMLVGITALLVTIWVVHKQHGLFRPKVNSVDSTSSKSPVGVAEKKLLLVFLYFFLLTVVSYTGFSLFHRKVERYSSELQIYFNCEQYGHDPNDPCDRTGFEQLAFPAATAVSFILIELSPLVNFVFVINIQDLKSNLKSMSAKRKLSTMS